MEGNDLSEHTLHGYVLRFPKMCTKCNICGTHLFDIGHSNYSCMHAMCIDMFDGHSSVMYKFVPKIVESICASIFSFHFGLWFLFLLAKPMFLS